MQLYQMPLQYNHKLKLNSISKFFCENESDLDLNSSNILLTIATLRINGKQDFMKNQMAISQNVFDSWTIFEKIPTKLHGWKKKSPHNASSCLQILFTLQTIFVYK